MKESDSLKGVLDERIGIFGANSIITMLEDSFKNLPYSLSCFDQLKEFRRWVEQENPRMVVLDTQYIRIYFSSDEITNLKNSLNRQGTVSLVLTKSIDEIREWKEENWPHVQFYSGTVNTRLLKRKMLNLLRERLFFERPIVGILSKKKNLQNELEMLLRNFGIKTVTVSNLKEIEILNQNRNLKADAIICDTTTCDFTDSIKDILVYQITELKNDILKNTYSLDKLPHLVSHLTDNLQKEWKKKLKKSRDANSGLFLPELFLGMVDREITLSSRASEKFSILKLYLDEFESIEEKFGPLFKEELKLNLGTFLQNRVRATDVVSRCEDGSILILLSKLGRDLAKVVGERLRNCFSLMLQKEKNMDTSCGPKLNFEVHTYPFGLQTVADVYRMIDSKAVKTTPHQSENSTIL